MEAPPPLPPAEPTRLAVGAGANEKKVRALGWVLIVIGVLLSVGTTAVAWIIGNAIAHTGAPGAHSQWRGTPEFTRTVFKLFGALFLFGLNAGLTGLYQVGTGRRSPVLVGIMLLLLGGIVYFGYNILQTAQPRP